MLCWRAKGLERPQGLLLNSVRAVLSGEQWVVLHRQKAMKQPCCSCGCMMCARPCRFLNGMKAQGTPLGEAKVVFYGAGSSAVGVASMIARLIELDAKISAADARKVGRPLAPCRHACVEVICITVTAPCMEP